MDPKLRAALHLRYDGPVPADAAVPPDYHRPWRERLENRKRWAWHEVRRLGRRAGHARRAWRRGGDPALHREWRRLRRNLAFALRNWAGCRDRLRTYAAARDAAAAVPRRPGRGAPPHLSSTHL